MELGKRSSFKFTFLMFKDERRNAHFSKFNNERERERWRKRRRNKGKGFDRESTGREIKVRTTVQCMTDTMKAMPYCYLVLRPNLFPHNFQWNVLFLN